MRDTKIVDPIFVLCAARSGSTLLRQVLNAHPDIGCPPELNLAVAFDAISFASCHAVDHDEEAAWIITAAMCRQLANSTAGAYAEHAGKRRWCEKSLPSLDHAGLLARLFPGAQFICLYRECTDTIASANEACPWGYGGYGYDRYVRSSPGNLPMAFAYHWADNAEALIDFEREHPERCHRVRYEDMVFKPRDTCSALFKFLGLPWHESYLDPARIFTECATTDPGDYKIRYTRSFETASVGRGWAVPVNLISTVLQERINRLHADLGYPPVDANIHESLTYHFDGVRHPPILATAGPAGNMAADATEDLFERRVTRRLTSETTWDVPPGGSCAIKIMIADQLDSWIIDLAARRVHHRDGAADCTVLTDTETLLGIADGSRNPALELRRSRLRIACEEALPTEVFWKHLDMLATLLGPPAREDPVAEIALSSGMPGDHSDAEVMPRATRG